MSKQIQISVTDPCHENWDAMNVEEKGRFCLSCQKKVIDFSGMSDREVLAFFHKPSTGSVCGRFRADQLERSLHEQPRRKPWLNYFFQLLLPAFFISKAGAQTKCEKAVPPKGNGTNLQIKDEYRTMGIVATSIQPFKHEPKIMGDTIVDRTIKGKIVDENNQPIPFANIRAAGTMNVIFADNKGQFSIVLPVNEKTLIISSTGYEDRKADITSFGDFATITLAKAENIEDLVTSSAQTFVMGEISVTNTSQQKNDSMYAMDVVIKRDINMPSEQNKVSLYPNPVKAGTNLSIGVQFLQEGYYTCQFFTLGGQSIFQKEIWIDKDARLLNMDVPKATAGSYLFVLVEKKTGKRFTQKIEIAN
jgi:hypothetical protein